MCRGSNVFGAILLEADVSEIRKRIHSGERNPSIASDYGVSISTIHLIRHNRTWRHVA
jgi:FixJ family two-component response regulator